MVLMFTTRHAPVTPPMKEKSRAFISLPTSSVGLTLSILNSFIELRSSVYPGEPPRPRPLDGRVSATRNLVVPKKPGPTRTVIPPWQARSTRRGPRRRGLSRPVSASTSLPLPSCFLPLQGEGWGDGQWLRVYKGAARRPPRGAAAC